MSPYEVTRAAVELQRVDVTPESLELKAIDGQSGRFRWLTWLIIGVSFVHMVSALALFGGETWYEMAAAAGMTAAVDLITWGVANYKDYAKRRGYTRSEWVHRLFMTALLISMGLNGAYLWANRPPADVLPTFASVFIAVAFALFIPMAIGVGSLIRGELEDDRLRIEQQRATAKAVPQASVTTVAAPSRTTKPRDLPAPRANNEDVIELPQRRSANGKAEIMTTDVPAIMAALREAGITRLSSAAELGRVCGWASSSSASKATAALREAGHLREDGEVIYHNEGAKSSRSLDDFLREAGLSRDQAKAMLLRYGLRDAGATYSALKMSGKMPQGMTQAEFAPLFAELIA